MEHSVFVYGSLKRGFIHHDVLKGARFLREARLPGYHLVLYEGSYPALVPNFRTELAVQGEVFVVSAGKLRQLDEFEDCPRLYERARVRLDDGLRPWAYVLPRDRSARYATISGEWMG